MAVEIHLPSGRKLLVEPGQVVELLPSEIGALAGRADFEFDAVDEVLVEDPQIEEVVLDERADVTPEESL